VQHQVLISVEELVAGYTGPVVGPVSFSIHAGEVVGLNGANGIGKSTILAAITGSAKCFGGTISRAPGLRVAHHRQLAIRPDELPVRGVELAEVMGANLESCPQWLQPQMERPVDELSGGQYQFLQTWLCLAGPADLILLDEPSNNLDHRGITLLTDLLHGLGPERSVVLVSHETDFLAANCARIIEVQR